MAKAKDELHAAGVLRCWCVLHAAHLLPMLLPTCRLPDLAHAVMRQVCWCVLRAAALDILIVNIACRVVQW